MQIAMFQVDAFADRPFTGNPAAVCLLDEWPSDDVLQAIAAENNLSETAFVGPGCERLRWFTPVAEVDLCGHATLASAFVLFEAPGVNIDTVEFQTLSGPISVHREGDLLTLDFPSLPPSPCTPEDRLTTALGARPAEVFASRSSYMAVYATEAEIRALSPDMAALASLEQDRVMVTARGDDVDFVSRFFAPALGVPEDPVTGSAHCTLAPFWAERLGRSRLRARQVSRRGGELVCEVRGDRVRISGRAVLYMRGEITV